MCETSNFDFAVTYNVEDNPSIDDIIKSLQGWNNIVKAISRDIKDACKDEDFQLIFDIQQIRRGSFVEDFIIHLVFSSKEKYQAFMDKIGGLSPMQKTMIVALTALVAMGVNQLLSGKDFALDVPGDGNTINISDRSLQIVKENIPQVVAISKKQRGSMKIDEFEIPSEAIAQMPSKYTREPERETLVRNNLEINLRAIDFDKTTNWYGKTTVDDKQVKAKIDFVDPSDAEKIKSNITSSEIQFYADVDLIVNKGTSKVELIIVKEVY